LKYNSDVLGWWIGLTDEVIEGKWVWNDTLKDVEYTGDCKSNTMLIFDIKET